MTCLHKTILIFIKSYIQTNLKLKPDFSDDNMKSVFLILALICASNATYAPFDKGPGNNGSVSDSFMFLLCFLVEKMWQIYLTREFIQNSRSLTNVLMLPFFVVHLNNNVLNFSNVAGFRFFGFLFSALKTFDLVQCFSLKLKTFEIL